MLILAKRSAGRLVSDLTVEEFRQLLGSSVGGSMPSVSTLTSVPEGPPATVAVSPHSPVINLLSETDRGASSSSPQIIQSSPDVRVGGKGRSRKRDSSGK